MTQVHPTSSVDKRAVLASDVVIGPYCTIEGRVAVGEGTRLLRHVSLTGPMTIGRNNTLHPFACLGGPPQHRGFDPNDEGVGTEIGDDNVFRESFTLNRACGTRPTTVGSRNYFMANSHVGHDALVGSDCNFANCAAVGGYCEVGDSVFLGGNTGVHQYCRVGRLAMLSAGMMITHDLTPFCTSYNSRSVGSLNLVGLRRAGLREHVGALTRAFVILFRQHHTMGRAMEIIEQETGEDALVRELLTFIRSSRRGITRYEAPGEESVAPHIHAGLS